jgi:hypothetical protein
LRKKERLPKSKEGTMDFGKPVTCSGEERALTRRR